MIEIDRLWIYLSRPIHKGNFSFTGFFKKNSTLFIVLGFFCAFIFYIYSYTKDKSITYVSANNIETLIFSNPSDLFIQISLASSFIIIALLTWVILSEAIDFNADLETSNTPQKDELHDLYHVAQSVLKRYFFVFIFYALTFYDVSYIIFSFAPSLKILILFTSIAIQLALIYKINIVISSEKAFNTVVNSKYKLYWVERIALVLFIIIFIVYFIIDPNNGYIYSFFLFPLLLVFTVAFFVTIKATNIFLEIISEIGFKLEISTNRVNLLVFALFTLVIFTIVSFTASHVPVHDPVVGTWCCINDNSRLSFYDNDTFSWYKNSNSSIGYWIKANDTNYKLLFDENMPDELINRTTIVHNTKSDTIYALNDSEFWLHRS